MQTHSIIRKMAQLAFIATLLAGCASGPRIQSDYDHTIDFSQYRTYNFFNPMGIELSLIHISEPTRH